MRSLVRRRWIGVCATLLAWALAYGWAQRLENRLQSPSYFTGWLLLASIVFLALFQARKKLPAPPLGSSATWMQAHVYVGLASAGFFVIHAPRLWPTGVLESLLAALYAATFISGLLGLYWTRSLPRRLSQIGEEVVYERIAAKRGELREQAQAAVLTAVRASAATTLGEFYRTRLHDYFSIRRSWRYRLWPTSQLRKALMADLTETSRYLSEGERKTAEELFALVRRRDDLDYHEALQWRLKVWLFVHIALTYPLLVAAGLHAWTVHLFDGGAP